MKLHITLLVFFCSQLTLFSQVGINTTDPKATLSIEASSLTNPSNTDGLLIPKINEFPSTNPTVDQDGMQVFVTGDGSAVRGFYYWDHSTTNWIETDNTGTPSADWYETGTTNNPSNIADAIYTYGAVGIGMEPTLGALEVNQPTNEITASFHNPNDTNPNGYASIDGIKNVLSGTTNILPQNGINTLLSGNGTNEQIAINSTLSGTGVGAKLGVSTVFETSTDGAIKGLRNTISSNATEDQFGVENNFEGTGFGTKNGVKNNFTNATGNLAGAENKFNGTLSGFRIGTKNSFEDASAGSSKGTLNSFLLTGNSSGSYAGTENVFSKSDYNLIKGFSNNLNTTGSGQAWGMSNIFNGNGTGFKIGVRNLYLSTGQGGNQYGVLNSFQGDSDNYIIGIHNQFDASSSSNFKYGVTNLLSGPTNTVAIGTNNSVATSGNATVIGTRNRVGNALFNMTAEAFAVQNSIYPKSTVEAFATLNDFNFDESTGKRYGVLNRFNNVHTGDKTGFQNQFTANDTETVIGLNNLFSGTGTGAHRGVINEFANLSGGTAHALRNEFSNLNGASGTGIFNIFSGNNDLTVYGLQNSFNNTGNGTVYGSSTTINASGTGFKYGHYVRIAPSAGGFHIGLYSEALKPTASAAVFRGRTSIGTTFATQYTLPLDRGTANQILETDGSGNVSWVNNPTTSFWQRSGGSLTPTNTGDDILFDSTASSITFPATSAASPAMIYLFSSGTMNTDRMIFSQSAAFPNYGLMYRDFDDSFRFIRNGSDRVVINVGAVSTPLVVTGTAQATNFQSATTTYPDYVFEHYYEGTSLIDPNYSFPALQEVAQFIQENGHLPGVLPFSEVKKRGMQIDLAATSIANLEKIEELFLYTIELNKKNEQLKAENQLLRTQQEDILARLKLIEEQLD